MFDVDKFIEYIHEKPALWEKSAKEYSNKNCREKSWIQIGEAMYDHWLELDGQERDEKVKEMKNKWRHIRDNFLKNLNQGKSGDAAPKKRKYVYAEALQFLLNTVEKRKTTGNIVENADEEEDKEKEHEYENDDEEPVLNLDDNKMQKESEANKQFKLPKTDKQKMHLTPFQNVLLQKLESSSQEEDADRSFLLSLLPDYKKLNSDEKLEFRIMTLQFFKNLRQRQNFQNIFPVSSTQTYYSQIQPSPTDYPYHFAKSFPMQTLHSMQVPSPTLSPSPLPVSSPTPSPSSLPVPSPTPSPSSLPVPSPTPSPSPLPIPSAMPSSSSVQIISPMSSSSMPIQSSILPFTQTTSPVASATSTHESFISQESS